MKLLPGPRLPKPSSKKAFKQSISCVRWGSGRDRRLLPLHAVAGLKSLGRRLTVGDMRFVARNLAALSPAALKMPEIVVAPAVVIRVGSLARDAVQRAVRYAADRDAFFRFAEGVQGGRRIVRGTRFTVSPILARLPSGDTIGTVIEDYSDISRRAFEAALHYAQTHP